MMNRTISRVLLFTRGLHNGLHLFEPLLLVLVALGAFPLIFHLSEGCLRLEVPGLLLAGLCALPLPRGRDLISTPGLVLRVNRTRPAQCL